MDIVGLLFFFGPPLVAAVLALYLEQHGVRVLWAGTAAFAVLLATVGFAAHKAGLLGTEGSGMTPITLGLVVPLLTVAVMRLMRPLERGVRAIGGTVVGAAAGIPLAVVSHYVLSDMVPSYFGCCPL